ncbi:MAG: ligand-binding sensor domain-containing protein [Pyrinomonadaceae bacterium]
MKVDENDKSKFIYQSFCIAFVILLQLFFTRISTAQELPNNLHQWGAISSFHGLPSDRVNAVTQTADGILWFGTDKGLARYDGRRVQTVSAENLSNLKIFALQTDNFSNLWIGTEKGAFRFENNSYFPVRETADKAVNSILIDQAGIFLTTNGGAIFQSVKSNENSWLVQKILDEEFPITSLAKDGENLIASTLSRGLLLIEKDSVREITTVPRPYFINLLATDKNGKLWFGAQTRGLESGLYFSGELFKPQKIGGGLGTVRAIDFDAANNTWVGTEKNGAFLFRNELEANHFTFENTAGGLRSNEILSVFVDRENVVWFGTNKGVCRFDLQSPKNELVTDNAQSNFVRTIFKSGKGILLAGTNRGLFYQNPNGIWSVVKGLENSPVFSIKEVVPGQISVGAMGGFFRNVNLENGENSPLKLPDNFFEEKKESVRAIEIYKGKIFLAFYNRGLLKLENEESLVNVNNSLINPTSLRAAQKLWIGTANDGIFYFDGEKIWSENALEPLKKKAVWAIDGNEKDGLWIAAENGLFLYRNGELQTILNEISVRDVRLGPNKNVIYAATENGLVQLTFDEKLGWISSRLGIEQGLPSSNIFAVLPQNDNSLFAATNRGISRFSINEIKPLIVPVRILSRRLHQPDELLNGINLDYPQNSLALEVAALSSRTFPEQFQYSFVLRDAKGNVLNNKFSNDTQFLMENLAPGKYAVEAVAFDKNLNRSEALKFEFTVENAPFPWTSFLLSILLFIALVALIWAIVSQRKIFQKSSELSLANRDLNSARLDLANEAERERRRISRDLHDQTLADLRHLILLTDKFSGGDETPNIFRTEIENVSHEIRRICEDLSPSVLENIGLTAALEWALANEVEFLQEDKKYNITFETEENLEEKLKLPPTVQIQIYRIIQEVLSNISRHAQAENVRMNIKSVENSTLLITIEDDGQVFDPEKLQTGKGRGLLNIKSRAELIKADVYWEKRQPSGMSFTLEKTF